MTTPLSVHPSVRRFAAFAAATALIAGALVAGGLSRDAPADAVQDPTTCGAQTALPNGSFESPTVRPTGILVPAQSLPGWKTADAGLRMWSNGGTVSAAAGQQWAELNTFGPGNLFQDVATTPGQTLRWSLRHRGRNGTDVMRVMIGAPTGTLVQAGPAISDGNAAWGSASGTFVVPAGQTTTRFALQSVSTTGGATIGNFIDDVAIATSPCLITNKTVTDLTRTGTPQVGDLLRYTVATTNQSATPAQLSTATDAVPSGLAYVPGSMRIASGPGAGALTDATGDDRGDVAGGTVTVRLGDLATATTGGSIAANSSTSFTFDARVTAAAANSTVANTVNISFRDPTFAVQRTSTSQTVSTAVAPAADLSIGATLDTAPVVAGSPVTFTVTAANAGPQAATGVTVTDTLPAGLSGATATSPGGTCTIAGSTVTCALANLAAGASTPVTITATLASNAAPGSGLTDTGAVTGALTDQNTANNDATVSGVVTASADLAVVKTFAPAAPVAGARVTYSVAVTNRGPSDAATVVITDPLDPSSTFVSASVAGTPCTFAAPEVTCPVGTLAAGASATATIAVDLDPAAARGSVENTASVESSTPDPASANDDSSVAFQPTNTADLSLGATATPATIAAGQETVVTLRARNAGPSDAPDATLTDTLPTGLVVDSVVAPAGATCTTPTPGSVRCVWAVLPNGADQSVTVNAHAAPDAPSATEADTAELVSPAFDPDTSNNAASADVTITQEANLTLTKTASPANGVPGTDESFAFTVVNHGPSLARSVRIHDALPAGFTSATTTTPGCTVADDELDCVLGDLAVGASAAASVSVTIDPSASGSITNTAHTDSATPDPDESDNTASATVALTPSADVSVTNTTTDESVAAGANAEFLVTVTNAGPSLASAVTVVEDISDGQVIAAVPSQGTWSPEDGTWAVDALEPGASVTLRLTVRALAAGTLSATATASSPTADPDPDDNAAAATADVTPVPVVTPAQRVALAFTGAVLTALPWAIGLLAAGLLALAWAIVRRRRLSARER